MFQVPLVVRLEGTNVEAARKLLKSSGLPITYATNLEEAAQKVVKSLNTARDNAAIEKEV